MTANGLEQCVTYGSSTLKNGNGGHTDHGITIRLTNEFTKNEDFTTMENNVKIIKQRRDKDTRTFLIGKY